MRPYRDLCGSLPDFEILRFRTRQIPDKFKSQTNPRQILDHEDLVTAIGFRIGNGLLHYGDAQWAVLRDQLKHRGDTRSLNPHGNICKELPLRDPLHFSSARLQMFAAYKDKEASTKPSEWHANVVAPIAEDGFIEANS